MHNRCNLSVLFLFKRSSIRVQRAFQIPLSFVFLLKGPPSPSNSGRKHTPGKCPCRPVPASVPTCFWDISRSLTVWNVLSGKRAWPKGGCPHQSVGISHSGQAGRHGGANPPLLPSGHAKGPLPEGFCARTRHSLPLPDRASLRTYE